MTYNDKYYEQVKLLLKLLPYIEEMDNYAIKGGTAINFFVRDLPRLSVDIDLVYTKIESREKTLKSIRETFNLLSKRIKKHNKNLVITKNINKLVINENYYTVKIEINTVMRGVLNPVEEWETNQTISGEFNVKTYNKIISFSELYGSKICAALDRQHPRDLFDVKLLFENEGITEGIKKAFILYLLCHNRPIGELLKPNKLDIEKLYNNDFLGMTKDSVTLEELYQIREKLFDKIILILNKREKEFILSVKETKPEYDLIDIGNLIKDFPAFQWKLKNIKKMNKEKRKDMIGKLKGILNL